MTNEILNNHAMQIITFAGDARNLLEKALEHLYDDNLEMYELEMKEARKAITKAHAEQTKVLQSTIMDESLQLTLLFTHAQDTLMTIMSEMNVAKHLAKILIKINGITNEK